jgi:hypothetical protein
MVGKCANSSCHTSFRYLHEGKLFRIEIPTPQAGSDRFGRDSSDNFVRKVEWYWLCSRCSAQMTLKMEKGGGVITVPLSVLDSAMTGEGRDNRGAGNTEAPSTTARGLGTAATDNRKPYRASRSTDRGWSGASFLTR